MVVKMGATPQVRKTLMVNPRGRTGSTDGEESYERGRGGYSDLARKGGVRPDAAECK